MHSIYRAGVPLFASMLRQPIHFAPGAMPIWLPVSVIADHRSRGVRAVSLVVAREGRIVSAKITDAVMNGIVPVVIVIGILTVPAAVMRLQRVMGPAHAGVRAGDDNFLPCKT